MKPYVDASTKSHGTDVFFKDYARSISSKHDMNEMKKFEGKLGETTPERIYNLCALDSGVN
jgi:hypothetical protein